MKHCYCIFFSLFLLNLFSFAQDDFLNKALVEKTPTTFITAGIGINHTGLLSVGVDIPFTENLSAFFDLGSGGWGIKIGLGASYHFNSITQGSAVNLAYYRASGSADRTVNILNEAGNEIPVFLNPVSTINTTYSYNMKLGKKSKLALICGYALAISDKNDAYETNVLNASFDDFSKQFINILHPDGPILGIKFMFGIGGL